MFITTHTRLLHSQHHSNLISVCFYQMTSKMNLLGEFASMTGWSITKGNLFRGNWISSQGLFLLFQAILASPSIKKYLEKNEKKLWQMMELHKINYNRPKTFWTCSSYISTYS